MLNNLTLNVRIFTNKGKTLEQFYNIGYILIAAKASGV